MRASFDRDGLAIAREETQQISTAIACYPVTSVYRSTRLEGRSSALLRYSKRRAMPAEVLTSTFEALRRLDRDGPLDLRELYTGNATDFMIPNISVDLLIDSTFLPCVLCARAK